MDWMSDDRRKSWVGVREFTSKLANAQVTTLLISNASQVGRKAWWAPVRRSDPSWKDPGSSCIVSM